MTILRYTTNFRFRQIEFDSPTWQTDEHANWDLLDGLLSASGDRPPFAVATGLVNAFAVDYTPNAGAYATGLVVSFIANITITGPSTVNVDGLGAKALWINGGATEADDIVAGDYVEAVYDGTRFVAIQPIKAAVNSGLVSNGASGSTAPADADDLIVENNDHAGISILTPNAKKGKLNFGRAANGNIASISYDHATDGFTFEINNSDQVMFSSAGIITANGFVGDISGNATSATTAVSAGSASTAAAWTTPRVLSFTGNVTGSASVDGSAAVATALTIPANQITNAMLQSGVALANLGFTPQLAHANLDDWSGITFAADKLYYGNGAGTLGTTDFTAAARTLLDDTTVAAMIATLGFSATYNAADMEADLFGLKIKINQSIATPVASGSAGDVAVTFTNAFPTRCYGVWFTLILPGSALSGTNYATYITGAPSASGFTWGIDDAGTPRTATTCIWIAVGM